MKANHNASINNDGSMTIERTKTKIKFESKSQHSSYSLRSIKIERTKTKIKFESPSDRCHPGGQITLGRDLLALLTEINWGGKLHHSK